MISIVNVEVLELLNNFNDIVDNFQRVIYFTRDLGILKNTLFEIYEYLNDVSELKKSNLNFLDDELNVIAFIGLLISALISELEMIIHLKNNKMDFAWTSLIKAQTDVSFASSNHPINPKQLHGYINKLNMYEKSLFPEMMFASVGGIIKKAHCNICQNDYDECDHIKGKIYKGELCIKEIHEMELEEVSIVANPASKMNRVLQTTFKNETVDVFTFLPIEK